MKRIKKILPVLLGVIVLMFGSLTVSAAEYTDADTTAVLQFTNFIKERKFEEYSYKVLFYTLDSSANKTYFCLISNKPCAHASPNLGSAFFSIENATSWELLKFSGGKVSNPQGNPYNEPSASGKGIYLLDNSVKHFVVASNYDVRLRSGSGLTNTIDCEKDTTGFFPIPPVERALKILPEVVRNQTKVILTTAVACLALLVILLVLPKKLPRFLKR